MPKFPTAPKIPHKLINHGITRVDEYYWMNDSEDPRVREYLDAENQYLEETLKHTKQFQEELFQEMKGRIKEVDTSVPEKKGNYFYYTRTEAGRQYPIYCRKRGSLDAPEEILLDQNILAGESSFCSISAFVISPDEQKLAYSIDLEGNEVYTVHIKDLKTGSLLPDVIHGVVGSVYLSLGVEWAKDNKTIFYLLMDENHRSNRLMSHILGTDPAADRLIFEETDETFSLSMFISRSEEYILTNHIHTTHTEMRYLSTAQPDTDLKIILPRKAGHEYYAAHHGEYFYIITNDQARNFRLMRTPVQSPGMDNWEEIIPHREDTLLEYIDMFEGHIACHERVNGLKQVRISKPDGISGLFYVHFQDPSYEVYVEPRTRFDTDTFRFKYSSLVTPFSTIDFNMNTGEWTVIREDEIPGYDKTQYETVLIHATAADGKKIPMSVAYKKGMKRNGNNPVMLYGYGAYGASSEASFNTNLVSLLNRGFVFAIGHVRGGAEMGKAWYEDGRGMHKKNSFTDLIACAEHLIKQGYSRPEKMAIIGGSAGGLLVGACFIMRPDLFKAVICKVPFLDVITSMSDPSIPLTTLEYDEWGNPESKEVFHYMLSYSPYDNIENRQYPDLLLTTGFNDPRVAYWEPAKFIAKLRDVTEGKAFALLSTNFNAGHAGASGRYDFLKENMLDFAFLIDRLGASWEPI